MRAPNFEKDVTIDVADLTNEFREYPPMLFSWLETKSNADEEYEKAKGRYEEARSMAYIAIKKGAEKVTEKHMDALIETDPEVRKTFAEMLTQKRDLDTLKNYTEALRAKKDMIIQIGADARKD